MKRFLKFIEERQLASLLEKVDDHYEYSVGELNSTTKKAIKIRSLEKSCGMDLTEFFKEKLIFKLFNKSNWNDSAVNSDTKESSIKKSIITIAEQYNIKLEQKYHGKG